MKASPPLPGGRPAHLPDEEQGTAAEAILDALIDAGLRHELPWRTIEAMVDQLPVEDGCRWCEGWLDRIEGGWRCRACGRIDTDYARQAARDDRPNRAQAEEINREARESWAAVEARIAACSKGAA